MGLRKTHHQPWFYNSKYDLNTRLEEEEFVAPCDGYLRHWQDLVLHQAWCWSSMAGSKHHLIQSPTQIQWKHITWNISIIRWVNSSNILVITVWTCSRFPTSLPTPTAWSWRGPHQSWQSHWPWFLAQVNLCSRVLAFLDTAQSHFQDSLVTWSVILAEIMCLCVRWVQYIQEMRPTKVVHYNFQIVFLSHKCWN